MYTFLLTSEYERDQWGEAINILQVSNIDNINQFIIIRYQLNHFTMKLKNS